MESNKSVPSLYEWAGGMSAFETLFQKFYDKVLADDILILVFKHMSPEHRLHVAHFVAEVLGGLELFAQLHPVGEQRGNQDQTTEHGQTNRHRETLRAAEGGGYRGNGG